MKRERDNDDDDKNDPCDSQNTTRRIYNIRSTINNNPNHNHNMIDNNNRQSTDTTTIIQTAQQLPIENNDEVVVLNDNTTSNSQDNSTNNNNSTSTCIENGHRYGNYHNYYTFHPVLHRTTSQCCLHSIIEYISNHFCCTSLQQQQEHQQEQSSSSSSSSLLSSSTFHFRYRDIGCNEGDLTLEIAKLLYQHLSSSLHNTVAVATDSSVSSTTTLSATSNTVEVTLPTAAVTSTSSTTTTTGIKITCTGIDLDPELIQRAQAKVPETLGDLYNNNNNNDNHSIIIETNFQVSDVLKDSSIDQNHDNQHNYQEKEKNLEENSYNNDYYCYDLTTIFSTTMWIHIHGGDDGFRRVLQHLCATTKYYILIEPQPSKCYKNAAFRLRRLGLPPIDVSNERLHLRSNIENAIDDILKEFHFERVIDVNSGNGSSESHNTTVKEKLDARTQWNRSLRLYQRIRRDTMSIPYS